MMSNLEDRLGLFVLGEFFSSQPEGTYAEVMTQLCSFNSSDEFYGSEFASYTQYDDLTPEELYDAVNDMVHGVQEVCNEQS